MASLTGVGAIFSAAHRDTATGAMHGHTWEVTVWLTGRPNATASQAKLQAILATLDHGTLPDVLAWGEDLARHVAEQWQDSACVTVDVSRPLERIYARWAA